MTEKATLRSCPTCATKLTAEIVERMGVRHFQKLDAILPGKVRGMDIDYVLQNDKAGQALLFEFKPSKSRMSFGQMATLRFFRRRDCQVWTIVDRDYKDKGVVHVGIMDWDGFTRTWYDDLTLEDLGDRLSNWWQWCQDKVG